MGRKGRYPKLGTDFGARKQVILKLTDELISPAEALLHWHNSYIIMANEGLDH